MHIHMVMNCVIKDAVMNCTAVIKTLAKIIIKFLPEKLNSMTYTNYAIVFNGVCEELFNFLLPVLIYEYNKYTCYKTKDNRHQHKCQL